MALSQVQCLDNHNVNWRSSEAKPEFFYSEEQRFALEALVSKGAGAFYETIKKENIRDFLSDLELSNIVGRVEPFDPDLGHCRSGEGGGEDLEEEEEEDGDHSLEYWPDKSDCSIPELDLGWPDTVAYRGVTRATVYMQPPIEGQPHIKEMVRKMITQAQKVIAVVMDLFTDVDILKDMLEAGFKRKVAVYIILDESNVQPFLQMCEKAQMHMGYLKHLRVRSVGGPEFYTRFSTKFKGCQAQKFMFVDGDRAVCGSYSFTWSAARMDRNLITVLSGQVVETFDRQFQELYLLSKVVSLKGVSIKSEPEPEPMAQPVPLPAGPSESITRKLINPKYALVNTSNVASTASKEENSTSTANKKLASKAKVRHEQQMEEPPIHPGLYNMERANMFDYLPTWVEADPEPGSDILGYINIIDPNIKNAQPSQMNRIKICDTAYATAQFMLQSKEQAMSQGSSKNSQVEAPLQLTREEPCVKKEAGPVRNHGKRTTSRRGSQKEGSVSSPVEMASGASSLCEDLVKHPVKEDQAAEPLETSNTTAPEKSREGFASLASSQHLVPNNMDQSPTAGIGPPVPKPRTMPVTDFISKKNALNAMSGGTDVSKEDDIVPSVNGVDAVESEVEEIATILIHNDQDDAGGLESCRPQYSSSGSGSLPPSNASSISEEYYPTTPLQRRRSDYFSNGERFPSERKASDGHISRGSFMSPGSNSQSMLDLRQAENGKRRNQCLEEEIKRALAKSHEMQEKDRIYSMEAAKYRLFR
ncbi:protein FAM83G isoform X2 [Ascaphus truei]|uniref:protein FAM83G isoform X2 n=1 Tax=Ascaphus truei TaxID=8439 RepID=UPI003F592254